MIKLVNNKKGVQILIDDSQSWIIMTPQPYVEDYPNFLLELQGFDFYNHSRNCDDCKELFNDLGTSTVHWFLFWNDKKYRLDLSELGKEREHTLFIRRASKYFSGTIIKFLVSKETPEKLQEELEKSLYMENYEHCAILRDKIIELGEENSDLQNDN